MNVRCPSSWAVGKAALDLWFVLGLEWGIAGVAWVPDDPDVEGRPVYFGDVLVRAFRGDTMIVMWCWSSETAVLGYAHGVPRRTRTCCRFSHDGKQLLVASVTASKL